MKKLLLLAFLLFVSPAFAQSTILARYAEAKTVDFCLWNPGGTALNTAAVHSSGDTKVMRDEAAEVNTTNAFVDRGSCYSLQLTAAEMTAQRVMLIIKDDAAAWLDRSILLETYEDSSFGTMVAEGSLGVYNAAVSGVVTNQTTTAVKATQQFSAGKALLTATYVSGTTTTLDVTLQHSPDGTNWFDVASFAQVGAASAVKDFNVQVPLYRFLRAKITTTGTSPVYNVTVEVWGKYSS